jgi:hypothetical protein
MIKYPVNVQISNHLHNKVHILQVIDMSFIYWPAGQLSDTLSLSSF